MRLKILHFQWSASCAGSGMSIVGFPRKDLATMRSVNTRWNGHCGPAAPPTSSMVELHHSPECIDGAAVLGPWETSESERQCSSSGNPHLARPWRHWQHWHPCWTIRPSDKFCTCRTAQLFAQRLFVPTALLSSRCRRTGRPFATEAVLSPKTAAEPSHIESLPTSVIDHPQHCHMLAMLTMDRRAWQDKTLGDCMGRVSIHSIAQDFSQRNIRPAALTQELEN